MTKLPAPEKIDPAAWRKVLPDVRLSLEELATLGTLGAFDADDAFYRYTTLTYAGMTINLRLNDLGAPRVVTSFCRLLPKVAAVVRDFCDGRRDAFYDNLHRVLKPVLGTSHGAAMAEQAAYEMCKQYGVRLHS